MSPRRLDLLNLRKHGIHGPTQNGMNPRGILASHEMSPVTESIEMSDDGAVVHATQNRGCRNPVTVEMQDGKDRSVTFRVEIVERLPRTTGRTGLGLAVPHDGHDEKIRAISGL